MNLEPNDLLLFAHVVEEGSFTRAATRLGIPKSTLSRRIGVLESKLGERLLLRTTRKLTVSDLGRAVLAHARQVASEVDATLALSQHRQTQPSGRLRISMPADLATDVLEQFLARFIKAHPALFLEIDLSPRRVDLIGENFDVAIRMGDLADDASLAARRLAVFSHGLYAAPDYLRRHGVPTEPEALIEHETLQLLARSGEAAPWILTRGAERWEGSPPARASANSPALLMRLAVSGAGIAVLTDFFAEPHLRAGELVQILAQWNLPTVAAWAVFPGRRLMPARTRAFLDALAAEFSDPRCQQVEARIERTKRERSRVAT